MLAAICKTRLSTRTSRSSTNARSFHSVQKAAFRNNSYVSIRATQKQFTSNNLLFGGSKTTIPTFSRVNNYNSQNARFYSSKDLKNDSEMIEEEGEGEGGEELDLLSSLQYEMTEIESAADFSIPEEYQLVRDGDNVVLSLSQEEPGKKVTAYWNVNDGPNYSEFAHERMKKEEEQAKLERQQQNEGEENENENEEEINEEDDPDMSDDEKRDIPVRVVVESGSGNVEFKCTVSKDSTIFLDSITAGGKTLDDIFSLSENTIERLFEYLEEHGVTDGFGAFVQQYNVSRKMKSNFQVVRGLVQFLQKE